jgi:hypothetical protein
MVKKRGTRSLRSDLAFEDLVRHVLSAGPMPKGEKKPRPKKRTGKKR